MTALDRTAGQGTERQGCSSPGEPQSNKAALPKTKGPASPQGIKSFYYLMIPSVVPEIPLWSHYAPCWDMVGDKGGLEGTDIYSTGRERSVWGQ